MKAYLPDLWAGVQLPLLVYVGHASVRSGAMDEHVTDSLY